MARSHRKKKVAFLPQFTPMQLSLGVGLVVVAIVLLTLMRSPRFLSLQVAPGDSGALCPNQTYGPEPDSKSQSFAKAECNPIGPREFETQHVTATGHSAVINPSSGLTAAEYQKQALDDAKAKADNELSRIDTDDLQERAETFWANRNPPEQCESQGVSCERAVDARGDLVLPTRILGGYTTVSNPDGPGRVWRVRISRWGIGLCTKSFTWNADQKIADISATLADALTASCEAAVTNEAPPCSDGGSTCIDADEPSIDASFGFDLDVVQYLRSGSEVDPADATTIKVIVSGSCEGARRCQPESSETPNPEEPS